MPPIDPSSNGPAPARQLPSEGEAGGTLPGPPAPSESSAGARPTYWRSLSDLVAQADSAATHDPDVKSYLDRRIPDHDELFGDSLSRRRFMQVMGASVALAGAGACRWETDHIVPESQRPDNYVPGVPKRFASAMELGGTGFGLLVTAYDGRPIKVDGNPDHPNTGRASTPFMQAALLEVYDPDRSRAVARRENKKQVPATWSAFEEEVREWNRSLGALHGRGLYILSEATSSPTIALLREKLLARYREARWHEYEPLSRDNERTGTRLAFGRPMRVHLNLAEARCIAVFDADLFGDHPDTLRLSRDFAAGRDPDSTGSMNRLWAVESAFSVTGASADHRLPLRSELIKPFLLALEERLKGNSPPSPRAIAEPKVEKFLDALARDLNANRRNSAIAVGPRQPADVHAVVARINQDLGNEAAVRYSDEPDADRPSHIEDIAALAAEMKKGAVKTLLILGGNPVYDAPADVDFAAGLDEVEISIHLSTYANETSVLCNWHLPRAHALESWGDARTYDGTLTLMQPIIEPIFGGRSAIDVIKLFLDRGDQPADQLVRETLASILRPPGDDEAQRRAIDVAWQRALHDGFVPRTGYPTERPVPVEFQAAPSGPGAAESRLTNGKLEVVFTSNPATYDGRFANNAWLQEAPEFLTKMTWDNAALIGPRTAAELGVAHEEIVEIRLDGRKLEVVAYVMPGQAQSSIALALGQGRRRAGRVGGHIDEGIAPVGFDAYTIRSSRSPYVAGGATVNPTGRKYRLSTTVDHFKMDAIGEDGIAKRIPDLVKEATLENYKKPNYSVAATAHLEEVAVLTRPTEAEKANYSLYTEHRYEQGHKWGMATDLSKCTGCGSCIVACQAENNVPVVGKEQVYRNREMHWIRVDRYFQGDPDDPQIARQPVVCQQCENAPCEQVCPVGATLHSDEGLNDMAYNRCVGTRYCLNNCPYRVRRFNFYRWDWLKEMDDPRAQVRRLLFNPEVTVRSRGVMEKCTFCVQRIQNAKIAAKNGPNPRPIQDGDIVPACAEACPTDAIVFGNLNDKDSRVSALHARPRAYAMLAELNTKPRNVFLARIRNPYPGLD